MRNVRVWVAALSVIVGAVTPAVTSSQSVAPAAWKLRRPWPAVRAFSVNDDTRLLYTVQVTAESNALLAAVLKGRPDRTEHQREIRVFRDTGTWISPPLYVDDAQAPKPIADGCGDVLVFWRQTPDALGPSDRPKRLIYARLHKGRWSTPKSVPGIQNPEWMLDHNPPVRLSGCRVALAIAEFGATGWSHRLVVVRASTVDVRNLVDTAVLPFSDLVSHDGGLTFVYSAYAAAKDPRHALKYVQSTDDGKTWTQVRVDTLAVGVVAQSADMFLVGRELWASHLEGTTFVEKGSRRLHVSPLRGAPTPPLVFASGGIGTSHVVLGSECNAPTLVQLDPLPRGYQRVTLHSFDGEEWRDSGGPQNVYLFAAAPPQSGHAAGVMFVMYDPKDSSQRYAFVSARSTSHSCAMSIGSRRP